MQSMTGFSRASGENEHLRLEVTIRTVNHRHLDINVRVPEELREQESQLRQVVAERLTRGRVEVRIDALYLNSTQPRLEVDESTVARVRETIDDLAGRGMIVPELRFTDLLQIPGTVRASAPSNELGPEDVELLRNTVGRALDGVLAARRSEGANLRVVLERLGDDLESVVTTVEAEWKRATVDLPEGLA